MKRQESKKQKVFVGMSSKKNKDFSKGQAGVAKKLRVYVGMSGGVDSSVSAALLKKAGFDVIGVFIKVWQPDFVECSWKTDRMDAMKVCAVLDIPFKTINLEKEYKKEVVDYMIHEYKIGNTPNPDVMCNRHIKFGAFFKWAMKNGADFVATGHYAKVAEKGKNIFKLFSGDDKNKDQSYFLWTLTQKELSKTFFPVGDIEKPEVRKLAEKFGLPVANKKDSQGLCFIGKVNMKDFLKRFIKPKKGNVLNEKKEIVGYHEGAFFLTLGQRHGFTITKKTSEDKPLYVVGKDLKKNTVTVSEKNPEGKLAEASDKVSLVKTNWITEAPKIGGRFSARIRYRQPLEKCEVVKIGKGTVEIKFKKPQNAVTSGQSLVLYDTKGKECLGGGIIV